MILLRKVFIGLFLLIPGALFAQSYHGEVRGLVTDSSHLVVNNAKVTLIELGHISAGRIPRQPALDAQWGPALRVRNRSEGLEQQPGDGLQ